MEQQPTRVVGRRAVGYIVDWLVWGVINAALWLALTSSVSKEGHTGGIVIGSTRHGFTNSTNRTIWLVLLGVSALLLFVVIPGLRGWSPGKLVVGVRVVNAEGNPPGILRSLLREILWIVDGFPTYALPLVGFITATVTKANQRVGDLAARTYVVRSSATGQPIGQLVPEVAGFPAGSQPIAAPAAQPAGDQPGAAPTAQDAGAGGAEQPAGTGGPGQPAGWFADPQGQAHLRWWDGSNWTDHTSE